MQQSPLGLRQKRLLVVCDQGMAMVLNRILRPVFHRVDFVETVDKALNFLETVNGMGKSYDAVIADLLLPGGEDAWRLVWAVREGCFCSPEIPIVILTQGEIKESLVEMAKDLGAFLFDNELGEMGEIVEFLRHMFIVENYTTRYTALVVDDDPGALQSLAGTLHGEFEVDTATGGKDGLKRWLERRHDLVVLDLQLPDLHGYEVLRRIRDKDESQPILIITAYPVEERRNIKRSFSLGEVAFVGKSLDVIHRSSDEQLLRKARHMIRWRTRKSRYNEETANKEMFDLARKAAACLSRGQLDLARAYLTRANLVSASKLDLDDSV